MYCSNCGKKNEEGPRFCQSCGDNIQEDSLKKSLVVSDDLTASDKKISEALFYGEDWRRKKVFAIASLPCFDVMIDKKYLYIIQMPKYGGTALGLILGLIILNIIGAFIGSAIGSSKDAKKRKWHRAAWVDSEYKIISRYYEHDVFLKVPLENLEGNLIIGKNKFTLSHGEKKITLMKKTKEFELFNKSIEKYVL